MINGQEKKTGEEEEAYVLFAGEAKEEKWNATPQLLCCQRRIWASQEPNGPFKQSGPMTWSKPKQNRQNRISRRHKYHNLYLDAKTKKQKQNQLVDVTNCHKQL
ncbi:hypothetical protein Dimus_028462 [Dionaea muscipula]